MARESFEAEGWHSTPQDEEKIEHLAPKPDRVQRSLYEVVELKERIRMMAQILSEDSHLKVVPGKDWAMGLSERFQRERMKHPEKKLRDYDPKLLIPDTMTFPEDHLLDRSEDFIYGVVRHEVGHLHHSDYLSLLEAQEEAKMQGYDSSDAQMIYNAWEDGRSNEMEGRTSRTAKHQLGSYLKEDITEALLEDFEGRSLPVQYGLLCWAKGAEPFLEDFDIEALKSMVKDHRVVEAFEKTEEVLRSYLEEPNARKAYEEELWGKGWPIFKQLIGEHIEDDARKQHDADQGEPDVGGGGGGDHGGKWEDLSEKQKEEYREKAREALSEEEQKIVKLLQPKSVSLKINEEGMLAIDVDAVEDADTILEEIEEAEQEFQEQRAEVQMLVREHKEQTLRETEGYLEKLRERESGLTAEEREQYDKYRNDIRKHTRLLEEKIDEAFPPEKDVEWEGGRRRGKRLDRHALAREVATGRGKMFQSKEVQEGIKKPAFRLLIDVSGSMQGIKVENALRAAILTSEVFAKKNFPFAIDAFNLRLHELKPFAAKFDGNAKRNLLGILQEVSSMDADGNDDGYAVDSSARKLQKYMLEHGNTGVLIVFSDGQPVPLREHATPEWELSGIVDRWSKRLPLVGIGIGPRMEGTIKQYYGKNGIAVPHVDALPRVLLSTVGRQVERFKKR